MRASLFRSHLFWFVVLGIGIFAFDARYNDRQNEIIVDESVAQRLSSLWEAQMQRPPTDEEIDGLIQKWIEEEVWYRQAQRLGLDEGDVIIRRRLIQKAQFVAEASASPPGDAAVRDWFEDHIEDYYLPKRYSFRHVYFQDRQDAEDSADHLTDDNWQRSGNATLLSPSWARRTRREIVSAFGETFTDGLSKLAVSMEWQGPIESEFGWHRVQLREVRPPEAPDFETVKNVVLNDYMYAQKIKARRAYLEALRDEYDVIVKVE